MGESGERDIFVTPIQSDNNGAFAAIGDAVIQNYQQGEGDAILFVDANNQWSSLQEVLAEVQPQSGNATILFNNNPEVGEEGQMNSLRIEGAMTTLAFGNTPSDIANVDLDVVTAQEVNEIGSIESYVDLWLA